MKLLANWKQAMSQKSSVSALEVRKAIDAKLFTEKTPVKMVRAGEKNFATTPDFSRSPLDLLIAIEERNLALTKRLDLAELASAYSINAVFQSIADTPRRDELPQRMNAAEQSAMWHKLELSQAADIDSRSKLMELWRQDISEWSSLNKLPAEEIRRTVRVKVWPSALSMGLVNTLIPANTVNVSIEPSELAKLETPRIEPETMQAKRERKQTARKAFLRKLRFIAKRELHHLQSVKRIDGVLTLRYWLPVWTTPQRTKRKASRVRFNSPVCSHYVVHQITLRDYLALYDDCGVGSPSQRQQWTREQVKSARPVVRTPFELRATCDIDRTPQRIPECFAGESQARKIHHRPAWYERQTGE